MVPLLQAREKEDEGNGREIQSSRDKRFEREMRHRDKRVSVQRRVIAIA